MRECGKCLETKPNEAFAWRNKSKGTYNRWCKVCMRAYDRNRYLTTDRPEQAKANAKASQTRNVEWVDTYLSKHPCVDCGNSDIRVLQFDHVRGTKIDNISQMARTSGSLERIIEEVKKCDVRCANCHMIRTGVQLGWRHAISD